MTGLDPIYSNKITSKGKKERAIACPWEVA